MPHAVTHVLIPMILLELYRDFFVKDKKHFPFHYIFIGGIAGILPDIDILVYMGMSFFGFAFEAVHRTFTHSIFFPLLFALLAWPIISIRKKKLAAHHMKVKYIVFAIVFGIMMHLLLDFLFIGSIKPFYPFSSFEIGLNLVSLLPSVWQFGIMPSIDAGILLIWLFYLEMRHKLSKVL